MICRPKASDGDRTWRTWEEAARFCSTTESRYHFRVTLVETFKEVTYRSIGERNLSQSAVTSPSDDPVAHCDLACWCREMNEVRILLNDVAWWSRDMDEGKRPVVTVNGFAIEKACPRHPCWNQSHRIHLVETVLVKPITELGPSRLIISQSLF